MKAEKFKTVFDSYPDADEIYVVNGMPFLERAHAANYASGNDRVEVVRRADACGTEPPVGHKSADPGPVGGQLPAGEGGEPADPEGGEGDPAPQPTIDAVAAQAKKGGKRK